MFWSFIDTVVSITTTVLTIAAKTETCFYSLLNNSTNMYNGEVGVFAWIRDFFIYATSGTMGFYKRFYKDFPNDYKPIKFYLGPHKCLYLKDAEHINAMFISKYYDIRGLKMTQDRFKEWLGFNMITVNGDKWKDLKHRTMNYLQGNSLTRYEEQMKQVMKTDILPLWIHLEELNQPLDLWQNMLLYSSKVVFMAFMGLPAEKIPITVHSLLNEMFNLMRQILLGVVVIPRKNKLLGVFSKTNKNFEDKMSKIREFIVPFIQTYKGTDTMFGSIIRSNIKRNNIEWDDVKKYLGVSDEQDIKEYYETNKSGDLYRLAKELLEKIPECKISQTEFESWLCKDGETDTELVLQEIISNLIGGSETTIVLMTFTCYNLAINQEIQEKLRLNLKQEKEKGITVEEQLKTGYLGKVINETLRLYPPGFQANRLLTNDEILKDGTVIPHDNVMWFSQYFVHRDKKFWGPDAEEYIPERWDKNPISGSYFPFSIGKRACPGNNYAKREAAIAVITLVENFKFKLENPDYNLILDANITLRPREPIKLKLEKTE